MIDSKLLSQYGATEHSYKKGEKLFGEGSKCNFYYQVISGNIKMYNLSEDGKEFIQGMFSDGQSFGEPPVIGGFDYPAAAITTSDSLLFKLKRERFLDLLKENFDVHLSLTQALSKRIAYKATILREISSHTPDHRILALIDYFKAEKNHNSSDSNEKYEVKLTRQQLAELLGLRVETVIRAIKVLETKGELEIINRHVFR